MSTSSRSIPLPRFLRPWAALSLVLALLAASGTAAAQQCTCDPLLPPCTTAVAKWLNEDGNGPLHFVGAGGSGGTNVPVTHANRFDFPAGTVITHVCVALQSPTGGVGQPGEIRISGELGGFPGVPFHGTPFTIAPTGDHQIVPLSTPIGVAGITWVQVHYPTARATIGHQGTRPITAGKSAVQPQGFAWEDYQNIPVLGYQGKAAIIRPMTLAPVLTGVSITALTSLETSEPGGVATLAFALAGVQPLDDVVIGFTTSDPCEGRVASAQLVFTPANWSIPQALDVVGVDDGLFDRDRPYDLLAGPTLSNDLCWNGLTVGPVGLVNRDDEVAACTLGFSAATSVALPFAPFELATGDLDGDGRLDLITVSRMNSTVIVHLNQGGGTFGPGTSWATGASPEDVQLLDFDHDLDLDVLVASEGAGTVSVHRNDGTGALLAPLSFAVGADPRAIALGDLDGNGWDDVVTANTNPPSNNLSMLLADGTGSFLPEVDIPVGTNPLALAIADLDGNGTLDIAVANSSSHDLSILLNGGPATFVETRVFAGGSFLNEIAAGDWDGDGDVDLAVARTSPDDVALFENDGTGGFTPAGAHWVGNYPIDLVSSDLDRDGDLDLAATVVNGLAVVVLENLGGVFTSLGALAVGSAPLGLAAGDLDNDGTVDLAVANSAGASLSLLYGTCIAANVLELECPAPGFAGTTNTFTARGGTPNARIYFLVGLQAGSTQLPGCAGLLLGMRNPQLIGFDRANAAGIATVSTVVPPFAHGWQVRLQAAELASCRVTPLVLFRF
jgi:hypothetical protein